MDIKKIIETIKIGCQFLEDEGYMFKSIDRHIWYEKNNINEGFKIEFSWIEYDHLLVSGLSANKRFDPIEKCMQHLLGGNLVDYYTIYFNGMDVKISPLLKHSKTINNTHFTIESEKDLYELIEYIKLYYYNYAMPFFKKYESIDIVNNELQDLLKTKKIQSLITSGSNSAIIRFYVIALKCNNKIIVDFFETTYFPFLKSQNTETNIKEFKMLQLIKVSCK